MKRRIFLFQTLSILAAMVALLVVSWGVIRWVGGRYQEQAIPSGDENLIQARECLNAWKEGDTDWEELDWQLFQWGYRLTVAREDEILFSSLEWFQVEIYQSVCQEAVWPEGNVLSVQNEGVVMIGRHLGDVDLVAMPEMRAPEIFGQQRLQSEAAGIALLVSGVVAIAFIVLCSLGLTRYQIKKILRPVNALTEAAHRVEQGDFSTPVDYDRADEFSTVCAAFDQMQRHLLEEQERSRSFEQARTDLVTGISHDLRTPLTSVKGYIKGLQDGVANTPEKQAQYLSIAYRKACDMDKLLQRLFYCSKLETGNLPLLCGPADLGEFVRRFVEDARQEMQPDSGEIVFQREPGEHPVWIDQEQMYRVLTNLKENAVRYAGVTPLVLTLSVRRGDGVEYLRFADNGPGVSPEALPHLFEQFWRGDEARGSRSGEGSGLGLYIVKHIIEAHGGAVEVDSGSGLAFTVTLPRDEGGHHEQDPDRGG